MFICVFDKHKKNNIYRKIKNKNNFTPVTLKVNFI